MTERNGLCLRIHFIGCFILSQLCELWESCRAEEISHWAGGCETMETIMDGQCKVANANQWMFVSDSRGV